MMPPDMTRYTMYTDECVCVCVCVCVNSYICVFSIVEIFFFIISILFITIHEHNEMPRTSFITVHNSTESVEIVSSS